MRPGRTLLLGVALALALTLASGLSGCGLKGSLYLPQQKKSKVPPTPNNPAPDTPDSSAAPAPQPNPSAPQ
jgi:predicted small lipoprotein YifL